MALHLLSSEELRTFCRQRLESCELWLRRIVHDELSKDFGENYIETAKINDQAIFNTAIRKHVESRIASATVTPAHPINTLLLDHLTDIICKQDVYKQYFAVPMHYNFPLGNEQVRLVLKRLIPIRNALSHANPITLHDAERVLCYCNDIITSLVEHYAVLGMSQDFDAPSFTRYSDSLGQVEVLSRPDVQLNFRGGTSLRCGDSIRIEVEVDSHYPPDTYTIQWLVLDVQNGETGEGTNFALTLLPKHVSENFCIYVTLMSKNREWHRYSNYDARLIIFYRVLPPLLEIA